MLRLDRVLLELKEIVNWKDVVLHLGVPKHVADRIENDYSDMGVQKREAISWWMENGATASWKELADALLKAGYPLLATRVILTKGTLHVIRCIM